MKLCISSEGASLDSRVDPRFGRCRTFVFVDSDTMAFEAVDNSGTGASGGAGGGRGGGRGAGAGGRGAGGGGGRMGGTRAGAGPGGNCLCPNCGAKAPHTPGVPCYTVKCPECGSAMVRE